MSQQQETAVEERGKEGVERPKWCSGTLFYQGVDHWRSLAYLLEGCVCSNVIGGQGMVDAQSACSSCLLAAQVLRHAEAFNVA
jgi:hypothetical protein